jgi:hypothetical protein
MYASDSKGQLLIGLNLKEEDTLGGILFLGLKDDHLHSKDRVLNGIHYLFLRV